MPLGKFRILINNSDRGTHSEKHFSILYDAKTFYDNYKLYPGETIELVGIDVEPED